MTTYRRHKKAQIAQPASKTIWAKETPLRASRFKFYLSLTQSFRGAHIFMATLIARATLRLPVPEFVEGAILVWAMGVVEPGDMR